MSFEGLMEQGHIITLFMLFNLIWCIFAKQCVFRSLSYHFAPCTGCGVTNVTKYITQVTTIIGVAQAQEWLTVISF